MKFYDFLDKAPAIGKLVVVEGVEQLFAERAIATLVERLLTPAERDLNLDRFVATELSSFAPVEAAVSALPFLGSTRVVVVKDAHELRAEPRRALLAVAERVPAGNTLVIEDLVSPASKRPEPLGKLLGRAALRIDTSPATDVRERFVRETLAALDVKAEPAALAALINGDADLAGMRTDLEKLALGGPKITLDDVMRETLVTSDVRAYRYAAAAVSGRVAEALALAHELFSTDPRGAAVPLLAALAAEYGLVWEAARPGGQVPARARWRERELRPVALRLGERRARLGFERAVRGFESIVTGRADDPRTVVDLATAAAAYPQGR
ncbi:MAG: DNA polymerase III subunit delta [Vulcanimicrobiaceae bacterium]